MTKYFVLTILLFVSSYGIGQTPIYQHYSTQDYNGSSQNWAALQDQDGLMFFANNDGVLEFDGDKWRTIKTKSTVRSLAMSKDGTIYVGIVNDFGKLVKDSLGFHEFQSIKSQYPEIDLECNDVWRIEIIDDEIFFCSFEKIICLKDGKIRVFLPENRFTYSFHIKDQLYVYASGKGLLKFNGKGFELMPNTEIFSAARVYAVLPYEEDKLLIIARTQGCKIYSLTEERILESYDHLFEDINPKINQAKVYCGMLTSNGNYIIGSISSGILEMTPKGQLVREFNIANGLPSNSVYRVHSDRDGQIWSMHSKGITYINRTLPFKLYSKADGLPGTIFSLEEYQGTIYVATEQSSYKLPPYKKLEKMPQTTGQNWYVKESNGEILLAHNPLGFLHCKQKECKRIENSDANIVAVAMSEIADHTNLLLAGAHQGFSILEYKDKRWKMRNKIDGFDLSIYSFEMDKDHVIWVRCAPDDLYRLKLNDSMTKVILSEKMNSKSTILADNGMLNPYILNDGSVIFGSNNGVWEYDADERNFKSYEPMSELTGEVNPIMQDSKGNLWYEESKNGHHYKGIFEFKNDEWIQKTAPFLKFSKKEIYKGPTKTIIESGDGKIYFGTTEGLLVYDPADKMPKRSKYKTFIRKINVNNEIVSGENIDSTSKNLEIPQKSNDITFEYAGLFYEDSDKILYSYRLVGQDASWSEWSPIKMKEYTNLSDNAYTFQVKSKNLYGEESTIASAQFTILRPWYKSWYALLGYLIGILALFLTVIKIYSSRLLAKNVELERIVEERTYFLRKEKEKSDHLSNNLLRMFSIIGHDLRKPAISFRGITSKINFFLNQKDFKGLEKLGNSIEKEAHSLMGITDNLLKWALSQKDILPYRPQAISLKEITREICDTFSHLALQKNISLSYDIPDDHIVFADMSSIHTILRNLIDNAIKFTSDKGAIRITTKTGEEDIILKLKDSGIGMTKEQQRKLFTLEKNKSKSGTRGESGTGLGLHLVKELVQINHGHIMVQSEEGLGSLFTITLPRNKN